MFAGQVLADTFHYFWGQIMTGAAAGVILVLLSRTYGKAGFWWTIGVSLLPYAFIVAVSLIVNAIRAPVKLDNRRRAEIATLGEDKRAMQSALEAARLDAEKPQISALEKGRREQLATALLKFTEDKKKVLVYLLRNGPTKTPFLELHCGVAANTIRSTIAKGHEGRIISVIPKGPRSMVRFEINADLRKALEFHLLGE
ncbi:MAG TPA: hypothetical protein VKR61_26135 [Bryobacteraceae bacterium]|nr:hypothetical protein [Bryobacteraceae bacterium]